MWDHLRAALVALHLLAITLPALPIPRGVSRADLDGPGLSLLHEATGRPEDALGDALHARLQSLLAVRRAALAPLQPYYRLCGTGQSWSMFGVLNHTPARLEIDIDRGDGWEPLYHAHDPDHAWRRRLWTQERMRGFINDFSWRRHKPRLAQLADWLAQEIPEDVPGALRVRVQMRQRPLPDPAALRASGRLSHGRAYWVTERALR